MDKVIMADLFRYGGLTKLSSGKRIPGFHYMYYFRKSAKYKKRSVLGIYYRYMYHKLCYRYGFQIPFTTSIGEGFKIGHFGTVVINMKTIIGKNCFIAHSTTIGQTNRGNKKGCPNIGDKVWIGTGSVIVGNIQIGSNVLIAPNSYVNIDVPDNSVVIGNPAKVIYKDNPTEGYINHILN